MLAKATWSFNDSTGQLDIDWKEYGNYVLRRAATGFEGEKFVRCCDLLPLTAFVKVLSLEIQPSGAKWSFYDNLQQPSFCCSVMEAVVCGSSVGIKVTLPLL